ncbi:alpha/beta hydrolase [Arthrobacter sp. NPDC080073]|uniref:alpha/beta fold hydrolase n=1 Tax=Arthrobacter sp. NPDC080073 TaxID=3155919 RepID=UPI00342B730A
MPEILAGSVTIHYELSGAPDGVPLVLIHGVGAPMTAWYPSFLDLLRQSGFLLVTFDNRDAGLSSKLDDAYSLVDMSLDVLALLDQLGIERAHLIGQSMGGMIAQELAISHPDRVLSLCSLNSAPNPEHLVNPSPADASTATPPASSREAAIEEHIAQERILGLDGFNEQWLAEFAANNLDRSYSPDGVQRQMQALMSAPDRTEGLRSVTVPAAVIHGRDDRDISFTGGIATALALPNAELHVFSNLGHQIAPRYWTDFAAIIARTVQRGELAAAPASGTID